MHLLNRFLKETRGNVAMIFAILAMPLFILVGLGVDYSRIAHAESDMQKTIDNAAYSMANLYRQRVSAARQIADMINANSGRGTARVRIVVNEDKLRIDAYDTIETPLLSTIGRPQTAVTASVELDANRWQGSGSPANSADAATQIEKRLEKLMKEIDRASTGEGMSRQQLAKMQRRLERRLRDIQSQLR